jgi:hypothetical protein
MAMDYIITVLEPTNEVMWVTITPVFGIRLTHSFGDDN